MQGDAVRRTSAFATRLRGCAASARLRDAVRRGSPPSLAARASARQTSQPVESLASPRAGFAGLDGSASLSYESNNTARVKVASNILTDRLATLQEHGVLEKRQVPGGHHEYHLTEAGRDLEPVIMAFGEWAVRWMFAEPEPREVDPVSLTWWMSRRHS